MTSPLRDGWYRVQEFAKLAGITVRTLHHYDRVGLLKPRRTRAGYRVYRDSDLPRLQQILVLKFLGVRLAGIGEALKSESRLDALLKTRRYTVKRKRARLGIELHLLDELDGSLGTGRNWAELAAFVGDLGRLSAPEGSPKRQELDEALGIIGERRRAWEATLQDYQLNRDVRAAIARGETPDTPAGQALVARWRDAIERFIGGDRKLREALVLVMEAQATRTDSAYRAYFDRAFQQAS